MKIFHIVNQGPTRDKIIHLRTETLAWILRAVKYFLIYIDSCAVCLVHNLNSFTLKKRKKIVRIQSS